VRTELGLEVQALGWHTGSIENVSLRTWRIDGRYVVGVASRVGATDVVDLLVQAGAVLGLASIEEAETCAPARSVVHDETRGPPRAGWTTRTIRSAVLSVDGPLLVVEEHVSVDEISELRPDAPPRASHEANGERRLVLAGARFRADREGLALEASAAPRP
jgi:hypothetical protein